MIKLPDSEALSRDRLSTMDFYCDEIISGKIPVDKIVETEQLIAFHHTKPYWEVHIVVIPRRHIESLATLDPTEEVLFTEFMRTLSQLTQQISTQYGGCRVSTNVGSYQDTKHFHWYIYTGRRLRDESGQPL